MTEPQRQSLVNLMQSILACACCPPDIRLRAESLLAKQRGDFIAYAFGDFMHGAGR